MSFYMYRRDYGDATITKKEFFERAQDFDGLIDILAQFGFDLTNANMAYGWELDETIIPSEIEKFVDRNDWEALPEKLIPLIRLNINYESIYGSTGYDMLEWECMDNAIAEARSRVYNLLEYEHLFEPEVEGEN